MYKGYIVARQSCEDALDWMIVGVVTCQVCYGDSKSVSVGHWSEYIMGIYWVLWVIYKWSLVGFCILIVALFLYLGYDCNGCQNLYMKCYFLGTIVRDWTGCTMICGCVLISPCLQVETLQAINTCYDLWFITHLDSPTFRLQPQWAGKRRWNC